MQRVKSFNYKTGKNIGLQIISDNDEDSSSHFEKLPKLGVDISKLDDVNHALKGINRDWQGAKENVKQVENRNHAMTSNERKKPSRRASNVLSKPSSAHARKYI